jgi:hypothetical protein
MISNISKEIHQQPGEGASILVGYIPVDNLETCILNEDQQHIAQWKLFHKVMDIIFKPIRAVLHAGKEMVCTGEGVCWVHLILAVYMGDLPEQPLVTCMQQHHCPICVIWPDKKGYIDSVGIHRKPSICNTLRCSISSPEHLYYIHARNKGTACTIVASSNQEDKGNIQQRNRQKSCLWQLGINETMRQK